MFNRHFPCVALFGASLFAASCNTAPAGKALPSVGQGTSGTSPASASASTPKPSSTSASTPKPSPASADAKAPDVVLPLQNGESAKLSNYRGKHVVLYFYPKDDTPGCRAEAQAFRDLHAQFVAANTVVLGVSTQGKQSHQEFIAKEQLPFDLVVDQNGAIASAFNIPSFGSLSARQTVLIAPDGTIKKKWESVTPAQHAAEVLAAVQ